MPAGIVKVALQGEVPVEIGVDENQTVQQLLEDCDEHNGGGYSGHAGQIYGKRADGVSQLVSKTDLVNGFTAFVLTNPVKGGC